MGKKKTELIPFQGGGLQTTGPSGMQPYLPPLQPPTGGIISTWFQRKKLDGQLGVVTRQVEILGTIDDAYNQGIQRACERALIPVRAQHEATMLKKTERDADEAHKLNKELRKHEKAQRRQTDEITIGIRLDNKLKEVKVAIALTDLERAKLELDVLKKNHGVE